MRNRYAVDDSNRLIIKCGCKNLLTDGRFDVDKDNQLIYWLNEPASWQKEYNLPNKIRFTGNWKLNSNHDLELILGETKNQFRGDRLTLKGEIISTDNDTLAFEIKSYDKEGLLHIQILKLTGVWMADEYNRLCFLVKKKMKEDILTLEGIWQINKNQQIIYTYEKTDLKTKTKASHILVFEGFWKINEANRLTYILTRSLNSYFDFRVQIESPNPYPQEGVIKYRIGIGLRKKNFLTKVICLYGTWKFSRKLGLIFQMNYGQNRIQNIEFGTEIYLTKKDQITFSLTNKRREPLGLFLTFTRRFLKKLDAEAFLQLKKTEEETEAKVGIRIPF